MSDSIRLHEPEKPMLQLYAERLKEAEDTIDKAIESAVQTIFEHQNIHEGLFKSLRATVDVLINYKQGIRNEEKAEQEDSEKEVS